MEDKQFNVRLPISIIDALKLRAAKNVRSMNGELIVILTDALKGELEGVRGG